MPRVTSDMDISSRPQPPKSLTDLSELAGLGIRLEPAIGMHEWVIENILSEQGSIHNQDHSHLLDADLVFMWASASFSKKGRTVLGECEQVMFRAGGWQKARQEQQMMDWFGRVPAFMITLSADYCSQCTDAEFCALIEHELFHIAQDQDQYGSPKFSQDGYPRLVLRGHDVEEFVGVVRRYGASQEVQMMIDAAKDGPEVSMAAIARSCGTCIRGVS